MAAVFGRTQVSLKKTGVSATIPASPVAKLMYYFDCVCSCVEPDSNPTTRRLRAYKNYSDLSSEERAKLLLLCVALSPDKLIGNVLFPAGDDDIESNNEFLEISAVSTKLVVAQSLLVGGQQRRVRKIMLFKKRWIENNYLNPLRSITESRALSSPQRSSPPPQRRPSPPRQRRVSPPPRRRPSPPPQRRPSPPRQRRVSPPPRRRPSPPPERRASPPRQQKSSQTRSRLCTIL